MMTSKNPFLHVAILTLVVVLLFLAFAATGNT